MKRELVIYVLGALLLTGCRTVPKLAKHAEMVRQAQIADDAYRAAQKAQQTRQLPTVIQEADRALQAAEQAKETHRQLLQTGPDAQETDQITRVFQQIQQTEHEAQFIKLQAQADDAVGTTTEKIKSSQDELANTGESELNKFFKDLLCFHLQTIVDKQRMPTDEEYVEFFKDYAITRVIPEWEIKEKAESIIELVKSTEENPSPAMRQARLRLLQECTAKRSGN